MDQSKSLLNHFSSSNQSNCSPFTVLNSTLKSTFKNYNKEEKINLSLSTNESLENSLEEEMDFNRDFFPRPKIVYIDCSLVNKWQNIIKLYIQEQKEKYQKLISDN